MKKKRVRFERVDDDWVVKATFCFWGCGKTIDEALNNFFERNENLLDESKYIEKYWA